MSDLLVRPAKTYKTRSNFFGSATAGKEGTAIAMGRSCTLTISGLWTGGTAASEGCGSECSGGATEAAATRHVAAAGCW